MRFGDKRWNEVVAVVLGLGLLAGSVALAGGLTTIMVFGGIAWVQFMATVLAAELLVLAPRRRRPELPFVAARWSRNPTLLHVIIGIGAVLMLVREGALAPVLTYSFSMYRSSSSTHVQRRDHRTTSGRISFRGRSVDCHIVCSPGGAMCDAFREASGCAPSSDAGAVRLEGAVDLGMFPLLCFCRSSR